MEKFSLRPTEVIQANAQGLDNHGIKLSSCAIPDDRYRLVHRNRALVNTVGRESIKGICNGYDSSGKGNAHARQFVWVPRAVEPLVMMSGNFRRHLDIVRASKCVPACERMSPPTVVC